MTPELKYISCTKAEHDFLIEVLNAKNNLMKLGGFGELRISIQNGIVKVSDVKVTKSLHIDLKEEN